LASAGGSVSRLAISSTTIMLPSGWLSLSQRNGFPFRPLRRAVEGLHWSASFVIVWDAAGAVIVRLKEAGPIPSR
jgi:hypothetical protein